MLPAYTSSSSPPSFAAYPHISETRVEYSPRTRDNNPYVLPSGRFTHYSPSEGITVMLLDQENGIDMPSYNGLHALTGVILLPEDAGTRRGITRVAIEIHATLPTSIDGPSFAKDNTCILDERMLLWTATDDTHANDVLVVPRTHAFNCPFPGTYQHKDSAGFIQTWRLPPTHDIILQNHGKAVGRSRLSYAIHVVVTKQRPGMIRVTRSMSKTQRVQIPIIYVPRQRPNLPILRNPSLFGTLKPSPEEWWQSSATMKSKKAEVENIHFELLIPAVRVFGVADTIPFHVQMTGSVQAVRDFLMFTPGTQDPAQIPNLRVSVERDIMITLNGITVHESRTIGQYTPLPVPPPFPFSRESSSAHSSSLQDAGSGNVTLDWSGMVQLSAFGIGGFATPIVAIRDSINLWVLPANVSKNPFSHLNHSVGIALVTDTWSDGFSTDGG